MPQIVEAKPRDLGPIAQPPPCDLYARVGEGITLAPDMPIARSYSDISEGVLGMVTAQGPKNIADRRGDRNGDLLAALSLLPDLPRFPIDLGPLEQALTQPRTGCLCKAEERRVIVPCCSIQPVAFIAN